MTAAPPGHPPDARRPEAANPGATTSTVQAERAECDATPRVRDALRRRAAAAARCQPLPCRCRDPWSCRCLDSAPDDVALSAWDAALAHLAGLGLLPVLPVEVARSMRQRDHLRRLQSLAGAA